MYLIIFKNGVLRKTFKLTSELRTACANGDLSIVYISTGVNPAKLFPVELLRGEWVDIEVIN